MIKYVDDFIQAVQAVNKTPMMEIRVNGGLSVGSVELNADCIDIHTNYPVFSGYECDDEDTCDLKSDLEEAESDLDDARASLQLVCDAITDIPASINEYKELHPEEWKILSQLDMEQLEDFVKTAVDWYNIKEEVESEC